ncbi:MAG TPA: BlaI/MecI/CopY family transcriptional regulator [Gemmataceae bacterium]|nr:BlaI/MecI/CopY family transcriptional regulator [Gemmataceae bacterium]
MAGRKSIAITERQFEVLNLLWEHGAMTVREVRERLPRRGEVPYTTVLGLLQNMERAGLVAHDADSPAHRYRPLLSRQQATGTLLGDFLKRFFRGSAQSLVLSLVDARHLSAEGLREIEAQLSRESPSDAKEREAISRSRRSRRQS